jgi:drug/metabolite transporter (DMT)-like permease
MDIISLLVALCVAFLWGVSPVIHKSLLGKHSHVTIMLITATVNVLCVISYALFKNKELIPDMKTIPMKDVLIVAGTTITTVFLANILYYNVLKKHDSYIISALIYSSPIFTLLLAYLFLQEKITYYGLIGVLFIVVGVCFIATNDYKIEEAFRD